MVLTTLQYTIIAVKIPVEQNFSELPIYFSALLNILRQVLGGINIIVSILRKYDDKT